MVLSLTRGRLIQEENKLLPGNITPAILHILTRGGMFIVNEVKAIMKCLIPKKVTISKPVKYCISCQK